MRATVLWAYTRWVLETGSHLGHPRDALEGKGTSEAAPAAVRQAVGGGCQSGWGWLLSVTNAVEAGTWRQGDSGWAEAGCPGGGGGVDPSPLPLPLPFQCIPGAPPLNGIFMNPSCAPSPFAEEDWHHGGAPTQILAPTPPQPFWAPWGWVGGGGSLGGGGGAVGRSRVPQHTHLETNPSSL